MVLSDVASHFFLACVRHVLALSSCCCKTFHFLKEAEMLAFVFRACWLYGQSLYSPPCLVYRQKLLMNGPFTPLHIEEAIMRAWPPKLQQSMVVFNKVLYKVVSLSTRLLLALVSGQIICPDNWEMKRQSTSGNRNRKCKPQNWPPSH